MTKSAGNFFVQCMLLITNKSVFDAATTSHINFPLKWSLHHEWKNQIFLTYNFHHYGWYVLDGITMDGMYWMASLWMVCIGWHHYGWYVLDGIAMDGMYWMASLWMVCIGPATCSITLCFLLPLPSGLNIKIIFCTVWYLMPYIRKSTHLAIFSIY